MKHQTFAVMAAMLVSVACNGTTDPTAAQQVALDRARAQWNAAGIHDYSFDLAFEQFAAHDSLRVQVRGDQVVGATSYLSNPHPNPMTVTTLFTRVQDVLLNGVDVTATYDPRLGFPVRASWSVTTPAGGASYRIVAFTPLP